MGGLGGAFDKAKKKGRGGFGASKSGRFDAPKESNMDAPSASAYNVESGIAAKARKSASKIGTSAGFGSRSAARPKGKPIGHDTQGPGAYLGNESGFDAPKKKGGTNWGSTPQHQPAAFQSKDTPSVGTYDLRKIDTVGSGKAWTPQDRGFGHGKRFESPRDVVHSEYNVDTREAFASKSASSKLGMGFGGTSEARPLLRPTDAPGPGAYAYAKVSSFDWGKYSTHGSAAFASGSAQHEPTPVGVVQADTRDYEVTGDLLQKSFNAGSFGVASIGGGFGSNAPARPVEDHKDNPAPGQYDMGVRFDKRGKVNGPSASFASATAQRGATMLPSHADNWSYNPAGVGSVDVSKKTQHGFGYADRGLLESKSEKAELNELRALFA